MAEWGPSVFPPLRLGMPPSGVTGTKGLGLPSVVFQEDVAQPHLGVEGLPQGLEGC